MATDVAIPEAAKTLGVRAQSALTAAESFVITSPADNTMAGEELKRIKQWRESLAGLRKAVTDPYDEAKKKVMQIFNPWITFLDKAEDVYKRHMLVWKQKLEDEAREQQRKLDEQAAKQKAELEQKAREIQRKADEDAAAKRAAADEADKKGQAAIAERLRAQADQKAQAGADRSAQVAQQAAATSAPVVAARVEKVAGVSFKKIWRGECDDIVALCRAVADGKIPPIAVTHNQRYLDQQARSLEVHFNIPGCRAVPEDSIAASKKG